MFFFVPLRAEAREREEEKRRPPTARRMLSESFRLFGPVSPHVAAHILTNEDKCLRALATFQGSFPPINHSPFYPCPLGRLAGVPGCGCNEGHIVTRNTHLCYNQEKAKWQSGAASPEGCHFLAVAAAAAAASRPPSSPRCPLHSGSSSQLLTSGFH